MQRIVLASSNEGKLKEIRALLQPFHFQLISQSELHIQDADETASSFVENALIKARNAAQCSGLPALADDSGLVVDALNGAPGVHSARFAGPARDVNACNAKLLHLLKDVPFEKRTARYISLMVLVQSPTDPNPVIAKGSWEGYIALEPRGKNGFGYDPLFWLPEFNCSAAELEMTQKNALSHRSKALAGLTHELMHLLTKSEKVAKMHA